MGRRVPARRSPHPSAAVSVTSVAHQPFCWPVRVYWEDTDAGGIVYHANHLRFFERARTEWLRQLGVDQHALRTVHAVIFVVTDVQVRYHAPARLDDGLRITVMPQQIQRASLRLAQQAWRGEHLLAAADVGIACVHAETFRPARVPIAVLSQLRAHRGAHLLSPSDCTSTLDAPPA